MGSPEGPDFLYHGSPHKNLRKLEPRVSPGSGEKLGKLIYASPNKAIASIFLANIRRRWSAGIIHGIAYALITVPREEFIANDKGGTVYVLRKAGFSNKGDEGLGEAEWFSTTPATPVAQISYASSLKAMLDNGVQVYFVTPAEMEKINKSDSKNHILMSIQSENQRAGLNVKTFR